MAAQETTMDTTRLGRTGLQVSRLCLGCMTYGDPALGAHPWSLPEEHSRPLIRAAVEAGGGAGAGGQPGAGATARGPPAAGGAVFYGR